MIKGIKFLETFRLSDWKILVVKAERARLVTVMDEKLRSLGSGDDGQTISSQLPL